MTPRVALSALALTFAQPVEVPGKILPAGTYTFRVTGAGRNDPAVDGFSNYASLGYYSISGTVTTQGDSRGGPAWPWSCEPCSSWACSS